ncbi:trimethylamine methyltransferase family protein [Candidatus Bipolaricaulota bacterium]|nr:trimethylamine methyltransferase family protein [Candidatus Bipolaricaulota bacterium]
MLLNEADKEKIYHSALLILERVGVEINHEEARNLLREAGAKFEGNRAFFKPYILEEALGSSPEYVNIYDRDGDLAMTLGGEDNFYGTGSDNPYVHDPFTGAKRPSKLEDVENFSLLVEALPNIDFRMSMALPKDIPTDAVDIYQFQLMLESGRKPIVFTSADHKNTETLIEMASVAAGGYEELTRKPFFIQYTEPTSPLTATEDALERLLLSAEYEIPAIFISGAMMGATVPTTIPGAASVCLAEELAGVVISQQKNPGAPVIMGGGGGPLDMKSTVLSYGATPGLLLDSAMIEVCKYLDMPVFQKTGCSDSKIPDAQAALESTLWFSFMGTSEADLIHDVGYLESGKVSSMEMVVIGDEIAGQIRDINEGIRVEEDQLALEAVERVGPGGNYLTDPHTMENFRELRMPDLIDRQTYESWSEDGEKSLTERARDKAQDILEKYEPTEMDQSKVNRINEIVDRSTNRF